jgi:hypothetical protein
MRVGDATEFDPYYKWLGIPTSEQPPNHYRLLGIELFEEDPDVISAAADRQMGHVKAFATGPYAAHSQLLLNELSKARVSLLNPNLKPIYDQQLAKIRSERLKALAASNQHQHTLEAAQRPQSTRKERPPRDPSPAFEAVDTSNLTLATPIRRKRRRTASLSLTFFTIVVSVPLIASLLWYAKTLAPPVPEIAATTVEPHETPREGTLKTLAEQPVDKVPAATEDRRVGIPQQPVPQSLSPEPPPNPNVRRPPFAVNRPNQRPEQQLPGQRPSVGPRFSFGGSVASLPRYVSLRELSADRPVLGTLEPPLEQLASLQVHLIAPTYLERANRVLLLHRHRDTDEEVRWLVFDEPTTTARAIATSGDAGDAVPVAMLRATNNELSFAWLDQAGREESAERLENCILRLVADQEVHNLQLRKPIEEESSVVLSNWEEVYEFELPVESIANLPPANDLMLRVITQEGFPATRVVHGQSDRLASGEQLLLSFSSVDYAGLGAYWEQKGKLLSVHVSPGFRLLSYPNDLFILSRSEVEKIEKRLARDKREAAKEYGRRVRKRAVLNRNLDAANRINIQLPGGGTTVQLRNQKQAAVAAAQAEVNANEARITALGQLAPLIEQDESNRIPAVRSLATDLEGRAKIGFELYMPVGGEEILLYRKGVPTLDANSPQVGL